MKAIGRTQKAVFFISLSVIVAWIAIAILRTSITLELTDGYETTYENTRAWSLTLAIALCILSGAIRNTTSAISLSDFSSGMYLIQVGKSTYKIVKE